MKNIKATAFVLKAYPFGESHKVLSFFSQEYGQIKAVAYGVRKTKSKYGSTFELFNEVSLVLNSSKSELFTIKDFSLIMSNHKMRESLYEIQQLYYISEFIDQFVKDNSTDKTIYDLLKTMLIHATIQPSNLYNMVKSFELKSLDVLGFLANLNKCSQCNSDIIKSNDSQAGIYVSTYSGWLYCEHCRQPQNDKKKITIGTYRFLVNLYNLSIEEVYRLKISDFFKKEIDFSIEKLIISILGKKLILANWQNIIK